MEQYPQTLPPLGFGRPVLLYFQNTLLCTDADMEYVCIDGTIVKVHRCGRGAKRGGLRIRQSKSKGSLTTKILVMTDALGNLVGFKLWPGQRNDICGVETLMADKEFGALPADKASDADWSVARMDERGCKAVIPPCRSRNSLRYFDKVMYRWRHLVENFFCRLNEFKKIVVRSEKTDGSFSANIYLAATLSGLK